MQWLFSKSWHAGYRTAHSRHHRHELRLGRRSLFVAWPLVVLCGLPFVTQISSAPQLLLLLGFGFVASVAGFWLAVGFVIRPFGFSKGCSRRRASRKAITAFAPPESLSPWEASALLGTGDVASVWFQEMVAAGALFWRKVSQSEDSAEFILELGDLSTVDKFSASLLFTVVVPEGAPRLVKMKSAVSPECEELPVEFLRQPHAQFGGTDFSVSFRAVRNFLGGRLSSIGWFRNFSFPKRRDSGTPIVVGVLTFFLSLYFVGFAVSNFSPSGSSAVPDVAWAVAALAAMVSFPFGYRSARSVVLLTADGVDQFITAESWRRLVATEIGDRAGDAYEKGFGEEDMVLWLSAFGMEELKDSSVRWRDFTPLSLAWEESSRHDAVSFSSPPSALLNPPSSWFRPRDPNTGSPPSGDPVSSVFTVASRPPSSPEN